jgi:hypothetical protein
MEMDNRNLWPEGNHLGVKQLWEYFARYPYLARLRDAEVLKEAIAQGAGGPDWADYFAYAQAWAEEKQRYMGLLAGRHGAVVLDSQSVLVKAEAAAAQIAHDEAERQKKAAPPTPPLPGDDKDGDKEGGKTGVIAPPPEPPVTPEPQFRRFYGVVELDALRTGRDAGKIADAVIQHLAGQMGARVKVTLEIHAELPGGASDTLIRTVTENAKTLKFEDFGFEEG